MEKYIPCKWEAKESWSSNSHIRQIDLKIKKITRDKEGHYILIKGSIQEVQRVPYKISPRRKMPRHILIKLTKTKHKERILKAASNIQGKPHMLNS